MFIELSKNVHRHTHYYRLARKGIGREQKKGPSIRFVLGHELCDENLAGMRATLSVKLDPLDLVKRFRGEVSLSAMGTGDQWNVLDQE
jgi:hypothetical protein